MWAEQQYNESISNAAIYNSRLNRDRKLRLPYLDFHTGLAQNHSRLWIHPRFRSPGCYCTILKQFIVIILFLFAYFFQFLFLYYCKQYFINAYYMYHWYYMLFCRFIKQFNDIANDIANYYAYVYQ